MFIQQGKWLPLCLGVVLLVSTALPGGSAAKVNPCDVVAALLGPNGTGAVINSKWAACLASQAFNPTKANATLNTLLSTLPFYPYLDQIVKNPSPALPGGVDLVKELEKIRAFRWPSHPAFENALHKLFARLNDGHTVYYSNCYHYFPVRMAFYFTKYVVRARAQEAVFLAPFMGQVKNTVTVATEKLLGLRLSDYADSEVIAIEGKAPLRYITEWADANAGIYRDLSARLNLALAQQAISADGLYYNSGSFSSRVVPEASDFLNITLKGVGRRTLETIRVPWFADLSEGDGFRTWPEFYNEQCLSFQTFLPGIPLRKAPTNRRKIDEPMAKMVHMQRHHPRSKAKAAAAPSSKLLLDGSIKAFLLPDNVTAVLVVPDFAGTGEIESWQNNLIGAVKAIRASRARRLIIDLSNNPGGIVSLAYFLLETLFPGTFFRYPVQLAASPLAQKWAALKLPYSPYEKSRYADLAGQPFNSSTPAFFPVSQTITNGRNSSFSKRMTLAGRTSPAGTPLFAAKNIVVLTNGDCASSCAIVTYNLYERMKVRHVVTGGVSNAPMAFSGLFVGYILEFDAFFEYLQAAEMTSLAVDNDIEAFPLNVFFSLTFAQAFCLSNSTIPGDFVFIPAQVHLLYTRETAWNFTSLWRQVATYI